MIIKNGTKRGVRANNCFLNAMINHDIMIKEHLSKVKDNSEKNVQICVGSMGFLGCDGVWWEYGNPNWTKVSDFKKGKSLDAHAWVEYTDHNDKQVVIDPMFEYYEYVCTLRLPEHSRGRKIRRVFRKARTKRLHKALMKQFKRATKAKNYPLVPNFGEPELANLEVLLPTIAEGILRGEIDDDTPVEELRRFMRKHNKKA